MNFQIEWVDQIDSTNNALVRRLHEHPEGVRSGDLLSARMQTAGRGRHQRKWLAEPGQNLLFSFFVKTSAPLMDVPALTMGVAMGVDDALQDLGIQSALKWPNDVLVGDKKICGILSEGVPGFGVVVGVGLNVNMDLEALAQIDQPATSLRIETGQVHDLAKVLERVLQDVPRWIRRWECARFAGLRETYQQKCAAFGRSVSVRDGEKYVRGILSGFGAHGEALLQLAEGSQVVVWAGDLRAED